MKKTKLQEGITLIALIITIIILLILAVVTIGAIQESKIIAHAKNAASDYKTKADEENTILDGYLATIEENLPGEKKPLETEEIVWAFLDMGEEGKGIILTEDVTELDLSGDKEVKAYVAIGFDSDNEEIEYPENREIITVKYSEVGNLGIWGSVEKLILGEFAQGKIDKIDYMGVKNLTVLGSYGDIPYRFISEEDILESVVVGEGVKNISLNAFYDCVGLKTLVLPSTITNIDRAFGGCTNLTSITIKKAKGSIDLSNSGLTQAQIDSVVWAPEE